MKKVVIIAASLMLASAPAANAQALLNKLKEKATNAISNAVSEKVSEKVNEKVTDKVTGKISEKTGIDVNSIKNGDMSEFPMPDSKETLQPKRSSSFGWDGVVTPSKAEFPIPLMNEFPAVPSAAQLANPTEDAQIAYYKALKAVTLRAEELNADTTCEDSFTEKWRQEAENALMETYGLTSAEMEAMKSGNMSEAEQEKLADRMREKIFGGVDMNQLEADMKKGESMTDDDIANMAIKASDAVFDKYDAQLRKYFGCSAAEYKQVTRESAKNENSAATRALEKKSTDYMKTLDAATQKEAKAFQSTLQKELMQASMNAVPGANMALQLSQNLSKLEQNPIMEKMQKLQKYSQDVAAAWPKDTWSDADAKFSEAERKKIEGIKSSIYSTDDADKYNPLYLQAMELIRTYRERAAKVWAADVQARFDKVKNGMGDIIKIQRQAVADGVIPECALWRVPLNLVIEAGDVLAEAYSEFPCNYPSMYSEEVVRQVNLQADESLWWPEFFVYNNLDAILSGNNIFKSTPNGIFQFNKGKWDPVPENYGETLAVKENKPASASWKSSDGKREVIYNADGGFIQLPEGDMIYPVAWEKRGNEIIWAENVVQYQEGNTAVYKIVKCTYKL